MTPLLLVLALLHEPAVSRTHVAFTYDGQVWVVPRGQSKAVRVTESPGRKNDPRFSPDGTQLAYSSGDLYTVPISGGETASGFRLQASGVPRPDDITPQTPEA
jgi:Tol biopolymer transport system component